MNYLYSSARDLQPALCPFCQGDSFPSQHRKQWGEWERAGNPNVKSRQGERDACYISHFRPDLWNFAIVIWVQETDLEDPNIWIWRFRLLGYAQAVQGALGRTQPQAGHLGKEKSGFSPWQKSSPLGRYSSCIYSCFSKNTLCFDRAVYCFYSVESTRKMWDFKLISASFCHKS